MFGWLQLFVWWDGAASPSQTGTLTARAIYAIDGPNTTPRYLHGPDTAPHALSGPNTTPHEVRL